MKIRILTFTDCTDVASNELHAILNRTISALGQEDKVVVDPFVNCREFSVINCAFLVHLLAESCDPLTTVFLIVANALPTARANRARLVGRTGNGIRFVTENTGAISWLLDDFGLSEVYEYSSEGLDGVRFVSFGGKHFHAPEAVKVASMAGLDGYTSMFDPNRLTRIEITDGTIVHIDNFGVAKIKMLLPSDLVEGEKLQLAINGNDWLAVTFSHAMKNLPDDTWAIYKGSSMGIAEVGCVRKLTATASPFKIGDIITTKRSMR